MNNKEALEKANKIFVNIFDRNNPFSLDEILTKFAFDIKLPQKVYDSMTSKETWAESVNPSKFITQNNMELYDKQHGWMQKKKDPGWSGGRPSPKALPSSPAAARSPKWKKLCF